MTDADLNKLFDSVIYFDEVMLRKIHLDSSVTFWLSDNDDAFESGKESIKQPNNGTRYLLIAFEITDDEKIKQLKLSKPKDLNLDIDCVQMSGILCNDRRFHRFIYAELRYLYKTPSLAIDLHSFHLSGISNTLLSKTIDSMVDEKTASEWCKYYIYYYCKISSRRELKFKKEAKENFIQLYTKFKNWKV